MEFDDLDSNEFFKQLQTTYVVKYKEAQQKLWLICVPIRKSLRGISVTKDFVDIHVLKPSPFFKSHYVTTDENSRIDIEIEGSSLKTSSNVIKILKEETAYNDNYKPYKILLIERPLSCLSKSRSESQSDNSSSKNYILSQKECTMFLESFEECSNDLEMLDRKIRAFNSSYVILPHYLQDAAVKLRAIAQYATEEFLLSLRYLSPEKYTKTEVATVLENYVMCSVHSKLFPVIKKRCIVDDEKLTEKLCSLYEYNITPDQLGVSEAFCCQTPSAVVELASLNSLCSPAEKLHCLMMTLELLNQDVEQFLSETCFVDRGGKDSPYLTSDDLIPLLVNVIVQARPQYFVSNLYYVQNFCWEMSSVDKFSFVLVTFQAAKEFLMTHEFNFSKGSNRRKIKKELSLEELMEVTAEFQNNTKSTSESKPISSQSPLDHQLENVTKMIEASTSESNVNTMKDSIYRIKKKNDHEFKEENLGDFISNLRQKSLGLSYGKQT